MGLLTSILELVFVAGAGWFTIYYLIPKIESGEFESILGSPIQQSGATGSGGEEELVTGEMMDAVNGLESGTTEAETPTPSLEGESELIMGGGEQVPQIEEKKGRKEPYDPSRGMAGKEESSKKKKKKKKSQIDFFWETYYGHNPGRYYEMERYVRYGRY